MNVPVWVAVIAKWFGWPGMTSRLNRNSGTQNEWITSVEVRLNSIDSPLGISSTGSGPWPHMYPSVVTPYFGQLNSHDHWKPVTLTWTELAGMLSIVFSSLAV